MAGRTFAFGDIHGELTHLLRVMSVLPELDGGDTLVFLGDYLDRGPDSKGVLDYLMELPHRTAAKVVCLRGNHEDAWVTVCRQGWDEFVLPPANGCLAALHSFNGHGATGIGRTPSSQELTALTTGSFLPPAVVAWMEALPFWFEDEHGIYVHAGLPRGPGGFLHPAKVENPRVLAWVRTEEFTRNYRGKDIFFGHTPTGLLPQELSLFTPDDPTDLWETEDAFGLDTGCGTGGFLTAIELPSRCVYESRPGT